MHVSKQLLDAVPGCNFSSESAVIQAAKKKLKDGRDVRRMPFRPSKARDNWEPSERAREIREEWKSVRKGGGALSFQESDS